MYFLWLPLFSFLLRYFPDLLTSRFKLSLSLDSTTSSSISSLFLELAFKAMVFTFFSLDSSSLSFCISFSFSLNLPNSAAVVMMDKSLDSEWQSPFIANFYQDTLALWCLAPLCQILCLDLWDGWQCESTSFEHRLWTLLFASWKAHTL